MQDIVLDSKTGMSSKSPNKVVFSFVRTILLSLALGALISLDFILYLRSGSVFVSKDSLNLPVIYVMGGIFAFSFGLMVLSSLFKRIQKFLFAVCCCILFWGFLSQFLQIDKSQYLSILLSSLLGMNMLLSFIDGYSHWILITLVFIFSYSMLGRIRNRTLFYVSGILLFILGGLTGTAMIDSKPQALVQQVYTSQNTTFSDNHKKTVFLFMPNLMSTYVLSSKNDQDLDDSQKQKNLMLGFLEKYGFRFYPNAYVINDSRDVNLVESLNALDAKSYQSHIMNNVALENLWKFKDAQRTDVYLKNNQLVNVFKKAHFKTSGYQNQKLELCKQNNQFIVDRCYTRSSQPFDMTAFGFSDFDRAEILFYQWLHSLDVFTRSEIADVLQIFMDRDMTLKMALPYEQMYVVNSFDVLNQVLQDIAEDKSTDSSYFVYLDFPNNLFVYNEKCRLKPYSQWATDNPKFKVAGVSRNLKNYNNQMMCFWKQMDDFMQNLQALDAEQKLTVVMQGLSNGGESGTPSVSFVDKFKKNNSILLAIRDAQAGFGIYDEFCQARDIIKNYLFKSSRCVAFKGLQLSESSEDTIRTQLKDDAISSADAQKALEYYLKEIEEWKVQHQPLFNINQKEIKEEQPANVTDILSDEAAKALTDGTPMVEEPATTDEQEIVHAKARDFSMTEVDQVPLEKAENQPEEKSEKQTSENTDTAAQPVQEPQKANIDSQVAPQPAPAQQPEPAKTEAQPTNEPTAPVKVEQPVVPSAPQPVQAPQEVNANSQAAPQPASAQQPEPAKTEAQPTNEPTAPVKVEQPVVPSAPQPVQEPQEVNANSQVAPQPAPVQQPEPVKTEAQPTNEPTAPVKVEQPVVPSTPQSVQAPQVSSQEPQQVIVHTVHYDTAAPAVSGDFLLEEQQPEWEFDPAQALGVSGEHQERIIVKVK